MKRVLCLVAAVLAVSAVTGLLYLRAAWAHCDTLDGPVVSDARRTLDSGNVNHVLPWVRSEDESEIRAAFAQARAVRGLSPAAKELADTHFFETLVRIHRAGEGAPFTGLKPAGAAPEPAVAAADRALETGSADELAAMLTKAVEQGVRARFARARAVHEYVEFVHYVEAVHRAAAPSEEASHSDSQTRESDAHASH